MGVSGLLASFFTIADPMTRARSDLLSQNSIKPARHEKRNMMQDTRKIRLLDRARADPTRTRSNKAELCHFDLFRAVYSSHKISQTTATTTTTTTTTSLCLRASSSLCFTSTSTNTNVFIQKTHHSSNCNHLWLPHLKCPWVRSRPSVRPLLPGHMWQRQSWRRHLRRWNVLL